MGFVSSTMSDCVPFALYLVPIVNFTSPDEIATPTLETLTPPTTYNAKRSKSTVRPLPTRFVNDLDVISDTNTKNPENGRTLSAPESSLAFVSPRKVALRNCVIIFIKLSKEQNSETEEALRQEITNKYALP
jgi:hypothetical protein